MISSTSKVRIKIERIQARLAEAPQDAAVVEECRRQMAALGTEITAAIDTEVTALIALSDSTAA